MQTVPSTTTQIMRNPKSAPAAIVVAMVRTSR